MTLKKYNELKDINLKGYCYYEDAWGMTMTSHRAYSPELLVVVQDDGENCKIATYNKEGKYDLDWTNTRKKEYVAKSIAEFPCIRSTTNGNFIQDDIFTEN